MTAARAHPPRFPLRVLLVDNFFLSEKGGVQQVSISPHLGLMSLATKLEAAGHAPHIFDPKYFFATRGFTAPDSDFVEAWAAEICLGFADIVGFTAYGLSFPFVVAVAHAIRARRRGLPILLGGPHATILAEDILAAFDCFDLVARFECENRITEIVETLCGRGDPATLDGVSFRARDGSVQTKPMTAPLIEMEAVPRPALHLYPIDHRFSELPLEAGRGCPYDCTFCSTASFFQRRYRVKPNAALVNEMEWARANHEINRFNLNHDLFGLKRTTLEDFCDRVEPLGFDWSCSMRPDQVDTHLGARLFRAGCRDVYFGFETGSQRLQSVIKKKLDLAAVYRNFAGFLTAGPRATVSFITGFPEETVGDQEDTLDAIGRLLALQPGRVMPQLHILAPEPGTALEEAHRDTLLDGFGPENMAIPFLDLVAAHPRIFSAFRHFRCPIPRVRVRQASVFVQELLPRLGYSLTVHITATLFAGRLSRVFATCVGDRPDNARATQTSGTLRGDMWERLLSHVADHGPGYVLELMHARGLAALPTRPDCGPDLAALGMQRDTKG